MKTRIIVVVWTTLCLMTGILIGAWLSGPRVIQIHSTDGPVHPLEPARRLYPILISSP
jgi:hypothetical protein